MYAVLDEAFFSLDTATKFVEKRLEMTNGEDIPVIVDISNVEKVPIEVRDYFGTEEAKRGISKAALIANSKFSKIMGNFFIKLKKPPMPIKIFNSVEEAEKWIKSL